MRAALHDLAWVAWLRADPATLVARMPGSAARPFAGADPARLVADQARRRDARFAEIADTEVHTDRAHPDQVVSEVLAAIRAAGLVT